MIDLQGSRYFKLNLQSFCRHRTIEFRQHGGTVSALKISNWVRFLNGFIEESCRQSRGTANLPALKGAQAKLINLIAGNGQSADALQESLHLLPHSLRAAISYLRRAGVSIECARRNGQTIYRLAQNATQIAESLFNGIDESIRNFYSNRAASLA